MRLLPPKGYAEYLNHLLSTPPRDPKLLKRYKRHLIAVMDGFNYTMRPLEGKDTAVIIFPVYIDQDAI